jgi:hypothetical protein
MTGHVAGWWRHNCWGDLGHMVAAHQLHHSAPMLRATVSLKSCRLDTDRVPVSNCAMCVLLPPGPALPYLQASASASLP